MARTSALGSLLLRDLLGAVQAGTALAALALVPGCASRSLPNDPEGTGGVRPGDFETGGSTTGGTSETGGSSATGGATSKPEPTPLPESELGCYGTIYGDGFGYHGQCCFTQRCYTPEAGKDCAAPDAVYETDLSLPAGSGTCGCGPEGHKPISGPYAYNPAVETDGTGSCCYVVGSIGCDGRPLIVEGEALLAGLVSRSDWSSWS
ncbi:MAG TPA: hypothetical protein VFQ61_16775 [Polyangiaceae bacterium]|nr:hypothetical protein [Polyangiaceae bacterium]